MDMNSATYHQYLKPQVTATKLPSSKDDVQANHIQDIHHTALFATCNRQGSPEDSKL